MAKAFRGEAVVRIPRSSNNAGHGEPPADPKGEIFSALSLNLEEVQ